MTSSPDMATPPGSARLPDTALLASLIAFTALWFTAGRPILVLVMGVALAASRLTEVRLSDHPAIRWSFRLVLFGLIFADYANRAVGGSDALIYTRNLLIGQLCAAELTVRGWQMRPSGSQAAAILLSGLIMLAASGTYDEFPMLWAAPAYAFCLALSLRAYRPRRSFLAHSPGSRRAMFLLGLCLILALGSAAGTNFLFRIYHNEITQWGSELLRVRRPAETTGLSTSPFLSSTFGLEGSENRVLRLEHYTGDSHLRALTFDSYSSGAWRPQMRQRDIKPLSPKELNPQASGPRAQIIRLEGSDPYLFAPLHVAGITGINDMELEGDIEAGPLRTTREDMGLYEVILSEEENHQGPLCRPLTLEQKILYLAVSPEILPGVRQLAREITQGMTDPEQKVAAVVSYLLANHRYSLTTKAGPGDPLSSFLLNKKAAHCEYFGSAAAILLRCVGIPSRYVIGYYAHEGAGQDSMIVRSRDAHAWAECWIDGKGWITVEATPGDGRPDKTGANLSFWTRLKEWFQETTTALRGLLTRVPASWLAIIAVVLALGLVVRWWRTRERIMPASPTVFVYQSADAELAALAARFEQLLRRWEIPCPAGRPWLAHLAAAAAAQNSSETAGRNLAGAEAFVRAYNSARFGAPPDRAALDNLTRRLSELEKETT